MNLKAFVLGCGNGHPVAVCFYEPDKVDGEGVRILFKSGPSIGAFNNTCCECGQRAENLYATDTSLPSFDHLTNDPMFPQSARDDLKTPNGCLILLRKASGATEVKTLMVHAIKGPNDLASN